MNVDKLTALECAIDESGWDQPAWLMCNAPDSNEIHAVELPGHPPRELAGFPPLPPEMALYEVTVIVEAWSWWGSASPWDDDPRMQALNQSLANGDLTKEQYKRQAEKLAHKLMGEMKQQGRGLADLPGSKEARTVVHIDQGGNVTVLMRMRGDDGPQKIENDGMGGNLITQLKRIKGMHG